MTQVVLLEAGLTGRFGGGDGDLDHEEGVVWRGMGVGCCGLLAMAAKERVDCLAPGLRVLEARVRYR